MSVDLENYGLTAHWSGLFDAVATEVSEVGRVVRQDRGFVLVVTQNGEVLSAVRPGPNSQVVAGDWVSVEHEAVVAVLQRNSLLSRKDAHADKAQALVANIDLVLIVCGADRPLNVRRIERAVTQTMDANAKPVVVVTKIDLLSDTTPIDELQTQLPTVKVIGLSSSVDDRLAALRSLMKGLTSVMIGESGAGKSTLLNTLIGHQVVETGPVRERDSKGRHTTVRRELHLLPGGGSLIDTPGVRAIGLWAGEDSVNATFPDVAELADQCRFTNCKHDTESGCAITEAVESGRLEAERANAYIIQTDELIAATLRTRDNHRRRGNRR